MAESKTYSIAYTETKIPVSKHLGKLWKGRIHGALRRREEKMEKVWSEAIDYYNHDQSSTKTDRQPGYDNTDSSGRTMASIKYDEVENIVYANVNAIIPRVYMKNPRAEVTPLYQDNEELNQLAKVGERLINALAVKRVAPGFNLKPKAKRAVVHAELTNTAWLEVGYELKQFSQEATFQEIQDIAEKLQKAKSQQEIEEYEGKLMALEERIQLTSPSGPTVRFRSCFDVVCDEDSEDEDALDSKWIAVREYVATSWLNAVYGKKDKDGKVKSLYSSTHVLAPGSEEDSNELASNFHLFGEGKNYHDYGYNSQEEFDAAKRTMIWKVWDKTTRRLFLFHDKDWKMPIWVWDDPLKLDQFFPLSKLFIYTPPMPGESKGEASYYLDQQDAINEINQEEKMARQWVRRNVFYNSDKARQEDVEKLLKGADGTAVGIPLGEDGDISKIIGAVQPPSMKFPELFDKQRKLEAIDRISKVNHIQRGGEYKTNTTNLAIQSYNSHQSGTLDEHIDQIEDHIGQVFWLVLQLCLMNMDADQVRAHLGEQAAAIWRNMTPEEIQSSLSIRVVGGSTLKPTSQTKQKQALEIGQVLGQFASASPVAVIIALRAFERAFDEVVITEEDWAMIRMSIEQQFMQGAGQGGDGQGSAGAGTEGGSPQASPNGGGDIEEAAAMIDAFPPQAKSALARAIVGGAPIMEAVAQIAQTLNGEPNGPQ